MKCSSMCWSTTLGSRPGGNDESVDRLKVFRTLNEKFLQNARELEVDALSARSDQRIDDTFNLGYQKGLITSMEFN